MRDNGKEDARRMRDNGRRTLGKGGGGGGGADKRGAHSRYQFFRCGKIGGGGGGAGRIYSGHLYVLQLTHLLKILFECLLSFYSLFCFPFFSGCTSLLA